MSKAGVIVLTSVLLGIVSPAFALRCHGRIISLGDRASRVRDICGDPTHIEVITKAVWKIIPKLFSGPHCFLYTPLYCELTIYLTKEIWTYDFGPGRLVYFLLFRHGKLVHIETGGYGTKLHEEKPHPPSP